MFARTLGRTMSMVASQLSVRTTGALGVSGGARAGPVGGACGRMGNGGCGISTATPVSGEDNGSLQFSTPGAYVEHLKDGTPKKKILVTGCLGQIGSELVGLLRDVHGKDNVVASDVRNLPAHLRDGPFKYCDVTNLHNLHELVVANDIDWIVHLAGVLSATGERNHKLAIDVNAIGIHNVLEVAKAHGLMVFAPSSIAAFGPSTPADMTPNLPVMDPSTIYGVTKLHVENMGRYYWQKFGVDFRSLRYPGIISSETPPGGGTTDYAVDIFYEALKSNKYECFLAADAELPMLMMDDCLIGTLQYLHAPTRALNSTVYNMGGISFTPSELADAIKKVRPGFTISYKPDFRNDIANSWPNSIDDAEARKDWQWNHFYDLESLVDAMFTRLSKKLKAE